MKILVIADEESRSFWDYYTPDKLKDIDLILSCGDLKPEYLSFLVTMAHCPLLYIYGNHDGIYERKEPEGCICIENQIYEYKGIRILGLGGSCWYNGGSHQYTQKEMKRRVQKMWLKMRQKKGFDILLTHAPTKGINDEESAAHQGFEVFKELLEKYSPKYHLHGHVHLNYGRKPRVTKYKNTVIINGYESYIFTYEE